MKQLEIDGVTEEILNDSGKVIKISLIYMTSEETAAIKNMLGANYTDHALVEDDPPAGDEDLPDFSGEERQELDAIADRIVKKMIFNKLRRMEERLNA